MKLHMVGSAHLCEMDVALAEIGEALGGLASVMTALYAIEREGRK